MGGDELLKDIKALQARDVLEAIVAKVLKDLGFEVKVNHQVVTKDGSTREVDVWARRVIAGIPLIVYVSCKNLDRDIGAPVIDQEIGRVNQLREIPSIKFIVASRFNENGKKAAIANGFIPIEVGFKVDETNVVEAYKRIYNIISEIFTTIAPKKLQ